MAETRVAPLNDQAAIYQCLAAGASVGFLVLTGVVTYDQGEFRTWQKSSVRNTARWRRHAPPRPRTSGSRAVVPTDSAGGLLH